MESVPALVNPILSYEPVDSPSTAAGASNAPFAQKVADMISKKQEPGLTSNAVVSDDVYGLEQSAISSVSAAQQ